MPVAADGTESLPRPLVYNQWHKVMTELPTITKRAVQQWTAFAVDDIYTAVLPLLIDHKLVLIPELVSVDYERDGKMVDARVVVRYHVTYVEDGSSMTLGPFAAEGRDSSDKATNKAMQQALKYTLVQSLLISTGERDADEDSPEHAEPAPPKPKRMTAKQYENVAKQELLVLMGDDAAEAEKAWPELLSIADVAEVKTKKDYEKVARVAVETYSRPEAEPETEEGYA